MKELEVLSYKRNVAPNFIVVSGGEKTGKTSTLVSLVDEAGLEEGKRIYIVDVDHGLEPFTNRWLEKGKPHVVTETGIRIPQVHVETVESIDDFHSAVWTLPDGFDYYVIDTFTRAGKFFIKSKQPKGVPGERAKKVNMDIAALFEDYIDRFEELAWDISKRDAWLIVLCHETIKPATGVRDDGTEFEYDHVQPLVYGSAGAKLNRVATGIWRLQIAEIAGPNGPVMGRQFRTAAVATNGLVITAGDRTGALKPVEPANFAKCIQKIRTHRAAMPQPKEEK